MMFLLFTEIILQTHFLHVMFLKILPISYDVTDDISFTWQHDNVTSFMQIGFESLP